MIKANKQASKQPKQKKSKKKDIHSESLYILSEEFGIYFFSGPNCCSSTENQWLFTFEIEVFLVI